MAKLLNRRALSTLLIVGGLVPSQMTIANAADDTLATIRKQGVLRVGFSNINPWGFATASGELSGVEPTLIKAFAKAMGIAQVDGVLTQYVSLIPGLQAGRFDMIGAGMQIRPSRCTQVAFGNPEWVSKQGFVTRNGNPLKLTSLDDVIAQPNAKIGVVSGGAEREYLIASGVPEAKIVIFPDVVTAGAGLKSSRIDVVMFAAISARGMVQRETDGTLEFVEMTKDPRDKDGKPVIGYGAIAFRPADDTLIAAWNSWLAGAKASGEVLKLLEPFGFAASDIAPQTITVEELCKS